MALEDIMEWQKRDDIELVLTIAMACGPPIMIKFALASFKKLGFGDGQTYTTLEKRMKCGIGICGRCNVGPKYVCVDGPVFTLAELKELPDEI